MSEKDLLKNQRLETFKNEIKNMIANSKDAYVKTDSREATKNRFRQDYTKKQIHEIVANGTAVERAELSRYFFSVSGLYKRIILHYASFLSYYWICTPHLRRQADKIDDNRVQKAYYSAISFLSNFNIQKKCTSFAKDVLVQGGYYGILHDDGENTVIQDLPFLYCRSRYKDHQDIDIVEFNMQFFDTITDDQLRDQILKTYPSVIQKGYRSYKAGKDQWIFLPADVGIYFSFYEERPFFLDLIPLIDDLEDYKQIDKERNMLSLKRILTQEIPHDGMNLVFEPEEASEMHEGILEMLENNPDVDVITSYNKINLLDLSGDAEEKTEVNDAQQLIYDSAGVSKQLFSATTDSGLDYSLRNDTAMMMILADSFGHFFQELVNKKFSIRKVNFSVTMLPVSFYNQDEYASRAKDLAAYGYSFIIPAVCSGIDQSQIIDLKVLENDILHMEELLIPLQSSYTQSAVNAVTAEANEAATEKEEEEIEEQSEDIGGEENAT